MNYIVINREYQPAADGFVHLVPLGDFPGVMTLNGKDTEVTQRFDAAAHQAIVKNFKPKVLVDFEHRSMLPDGDTTAAAWVPSLQERADGIYSPLEFSDVGEAAVKNKRIRFLSPAFDVEIIDQANKIVRPTRLISVGLTNRPNLKTLQPLTNRSADGITVENMAAKAGKVGKMKGIIALLGLPEASEEATVLNSVRELMTAKKDLDASKARVQELETAVLNKEADEFLVKHAGLIKNKEAVKAQFIKNKADTIATFEALADIPDAQRSPLPARHSSLIRWDRPACR